MKHKKPKTILVAITATHAASRQKLRGIYRYAAGKDDWDITLVRSPLDLTSQMLEECASGNIDGFILSSDECSDRISRVIPKNKPIVAIEVDTAIPTERDRRKNIVLTTDNTAIGQMAAEHFKSLGRFASFAYIPDERGRQWSKMRGEAFAAEVSSDYRHVEEFDGTKESLSEFLLRLKHPVAIFAAWDFIAAKVVKTCRQTGLAVPSQVSILGVDDDDLICESVRPPLSTILVDRVKQGFIAAKKLDAMMNVSRRVIVSDYICRPLKVVERETTAYISPGTAVVERAHKFIADYATEGIDVEDVANELHISRRLLDMRFAEAGLGSVSEAIRKKRLVAVKRLLRQTTLSDSRIASRCGFKCVGTLRNLFRRTFGMSMASFRHKTQ